MVFWLHLIVFAFAPSASIAQKQGLCDKEFFTQFQQRAGLHLCETSLSPGCQAPAVKWDQQGNIYVISALALSAATGGAEAFQTSVALDVLRSEAFSKAFSSGTYFQSKLYGKNIYEGITRSSVPRTSVAMWGRWASGAAVFLTAYFYQDSNPERCNASRSNSYMTNVMQNGVCRPSLQMSPNVVNFISQPIEDQVRAARELPQVCEYYKKLNDKIESDLAPNTRLIDFSCEGKTPKSFTADIGKPAQKFEVTPVSQGTGHLIGFNASSVNGPVKDISVKFKNAVEIEKPKSDPEEVYKVMKAWWSVGPLVTACCDGTLKDKCPRSQGRPPVASPKTAQ